MGGGDALNPIINLPEPLTLGLHALVLLGQARDKTMSTEDLACQIGGSQTHLSKVLQKLTKAGFLSARRGPGGGYYLPDEARGMKLIWVFELLGGPFRPSGCGFGHQSDGKPCLIGAMTDELTLSIRDFLATKTLDDLLQYNDRWPKIRIMVRTVKRTEEEL